VPCEFQIPDQFRPKHFLPCTQFRRTHGATHRAKATFRNAECIGDFRSSFGPLKFAWPSKILTCMMSLQDSYDSQHFSEPRKARARAHNHTLQDFYKDFNIVSNSICLCCLSNPPEYQLECGHFLCHECALDFGCRDGNRILVIKHCPLHGDLGSIQATSVPTVVDLQPPHSGLRVLVLDGYWNFALQITV
jgi:hypothetical protein